MTEKRYVAIDLKSFYASVECAERELDPLDTNLVVADESRTDKTICLAVSPSLKAYGISGRARLFEAKQRIREVNAERRAKAPGGRFAGKSRFASELAKDPSLELDYIVAPPRMARYMDYSRRIFEIYLRHVSPEDILVYSIDEVFIDVTGYLDRDLSAAHSFAMMLIREVLKETGITATAGIGTNMYLAKIAMDIEAKRMPADADGVRIAELNETTYRERLWSHRPLTDFWRVGRGISRRLEKLGLYTMGDVARCSVGSPGSFYNEELLYKEFGINAELLIDHAWGFEPTEIADCKAYVPESKSLSTGQVLPTPYTAEKGRLVVSEMADQLSLDLVRKGFVTDQLTLDVIYDIENLKDPVRAVTYVKEATRDFYGRRMPKPAHGSVNLDGYTASTRKIIDAVTGLYDRIVMPQLSVRRFYVAAVHLLPEGEVSAAPPAPEQLDLFTDYEAREREQAKKQAEEDREKRIQHTLIQLQDRFGKNAVVKGMNLEEGATAMARNRMIGGHQAEVEKKPEGTEAPQKKRPKPESAEALQKKHSKPESAEIPQKKRPGPEGRKQEQRE